MAAPPSRNKELSLNRRQTLLLLTLLVLLAAFFAFDLGRYFSLTQAQALQSELQGLYAQRPAATVTVYALLFVALFALALPAGSVMSLAGGAIFGFWVGVLVVSFASTIGATLAFLGGRYLFADIVRRRHARHLALIDAGIAREGGLYLFTLRLVPLFPPALLSVVFGLTAMKTGRFYLISQLGMLSGTLIYVNAGTQLAGLRSMRDILSPPVLLALLLLGAVPWLLSRGITAWRATRAA